MSRQKTQVKPIEKPAYFIEWEASKVAPEIIDKNVTFLEGNNAYEALLYSLGQEARTNTGQLRQKYLLRYSHLYSGGWFCSTLDPLANFSRTDWGCLKPLEPKEKDGKPIKYEHPPNTTPRAFFLEIGDPQYQKISELWEVGKTPGQFWEWLQGNPTVPLVITEGAKKAGALLTAGYPAIALPGVNSAYRTLDGDKSLIPEIMSMAQAGREIILCFDQDSKFKTQKMVNGAILETGKLLLKESCRVSVVCWEPAQGKGIDDWIAAHGEKELHGLVENRISLAEFGEKKIRKVRKFTQIAHFLDFLRECELDKKLKFNQLTLEIELDGKMFDDPDYFKLWFCDNYSVEVSDKNFLDGINYFAKQNAYHPVRDYLASVADLSPVDLNTAATRYFGLGDRLSNEMLKRWLIGAVRRVFSPGCKSENSLVLFGRQGIGKSTFFETLGGEFHCNDIDDIRGTDNLLKQHRYWLLELAEFDGITSRKEAHALKSWQSICRDTFREPYGRKTRSYPRGFSVAGSVNKVEFLNDETGSRRFWVLDLGSRQVNLDLVAAERDRLWAAAVQAFNQGEAHWLDRESDRQLSEQNAKFEQFDEWQGVIEEHLINTHIANAGEILRECFKIEQNAPDFKRQVSRITKILTRLKWGKFRQMRCYIGGQPSRMMFWISPQLQQAIEAGEVLETATLQEFEAFCPSLDTAPIHNDQDPVVAIPPAIAEGGGYTQDLSYSRLETPNKSMVTASPAIVPIDKRDFPENLKSDSNGNGSNGNVRTKKQPKGILDESHRESLVEEINGYKEMLGLTAEALAEIIKKAAKKDSILDCSGADLMNIIYWLRRQLP